MKEGQYTEEEILDNNENTYLFNEFLSILGDTVVLKGRLRRVASSSELRVTDRQKSECYKYQVAGVVVFITGTIISYSSLCLGTIVAIIICLPIRRKKSTYCPNVIDCLTNDVANRFREVQRWPGHSARPDGRVLGVHKLAEYRDHVPRFYFFTVRKT